jgi:cell division protein FtsA
MEGIGDLAADSFGTGVRIGSPAEHIGGLTDAVEAPRFATVVGLALYGANRLLLGGGQSSNRRKINSPAMNDLGKKLKNWLQDFF